MRNFKLLFWKIFTEHAQVQVFMYSVMFVVTFLMLFLSSYNLELSLIIGILLPSCLKLISAILSAFKAWYIIRRCKLGDYYFLETYMEWTGKYY